MAKRRSLEEEMAAFDDYLRYGTDEERSKRPTTRRVYCWTVTLLHRFLKGRAPSLDLGREFIMSLEGNGNSASSINRHIWALKSYFRFKGKKFKLRGLPIEETYPRYLRDEEWEALLDTVVRPTQDLDLPEYARRRGRLELALVLAYGGAGLRCSEAVSLQLDDIIEEGYLRVTRKGGREDFVPVEIEVITVLKEYLETRDAAGPFVFPGKGPGTHMAPRTAQGIIKALCRRAGLPDAHVHSLRHTVGYQLRKGGLTERDIQDVLGHKNVSATKIYTHMTREDLRSRLPKRLNGARQRRLM